MVGFWGYGVGGDHDCMGDLTQMRAVDFAIVWQPIDHDTENRKDKFDGALR